MTVLKYQCIPSCAELQGDYKSTVESPAMLRLRKTSQTAALQRSSTDAVRSPVSPRTPGKSAGECVQQMNGTKDLMSTSV